jgi:hypothetical protein
MDYRRRAPTGLRLTRRRAGGLRSVRLLREFETAAVRNRLEELDPSASTSAPSRPSAGWP